MEELERVKELIASGAIEAALKRLDTLLTDDNATLPRDMLYYLKGNAYWKCGDSQHALDNYQYAIDINADSPAAAARAMIIEILNFYNKDMYNQ